MYWAVSILIFVLLGLAIYLDVLWKELGLGDAHGCLFGDAEDSNITKHWIADTWRGIWNRADFVRHAEGPLGSHSFRKYPATVARRMGCDRDDIDSRARWRKRRMQDRYVSPNLPFPDAKVAAALCVGGRCKYELVDGSAITQPWLREVVVPNIIAKPGISDCVADVLALPLLWAAVEPEMEGQMPETTRNRIRNAYNNQRVLVEGLNPVRKRLLVISGQDARLNITVVPDGGGFGGGMGGGGAVGGGMNGDDGQALHAWMHALEMSLMSMREFVNDAMDRQMAYMQVMNRNVRRIAVQPGVRQAAANNGQPAVAQLSPLPGNLHSLWREWTHGIGRQKAASLFTAMERGQNKYKFHRRKVVWEVISHLVRSGRTAQTAIDMIYAAYGNGSVTSIINRMRRDRANGGHPNLR